MYNYSFASLRVHLRVLLREGRTERALAIVKKTLDLDEKQGEGRTERALAIVKKTLDLDEKQGRAYLNILTDYLTNRQVLRYRTQPWRVVLMEITEEMEAGEMPNEVYQAYTGASSMESYEIATLMFAAFHNEEWEGIDPSLHTYLETRDKLAAKPQREQVVVRRLAAAPTRRKA